MGRIRFKFKKPDPSLNLGEGYIGHYSSYSFALHLSDIDGKWRVLWCVSGKKKMLREGPAFDTVEEAGKCAEDLLENLLRPRN